jgi:thiosulfate/3-mercaptopyruvate sulfurtransferase
MTGRPIRYLLIAAVLVGFAWWSLAAARENDRQGPDGNPPYPNGHLLATVDWLAGHLESSVVLDVRTDEYFDNTVIPGAIRMPWSLLRSDEKAKNLASTFVGISRAEEILGRHGITRKTPVVLYDSVARDGGATASYVFWVLDMLGHEKVRVLEGGIDAWKKAGRKVETRAASPASVTYETPPGKIRRERLIDGAFIESRLNDPHYQIIDVRSSEEYRGESRRYRPWFPAALVLAGVILFIFVTHGPPAFSSGFVTTLKGLIGTAGPDYVEEKAHYRMLPGAGSWLMAFVIGMAGS